MEAEAEGPGVSPAVERTAQAFITGCGFLAGGRQQRVALAIYELLMRGKPAPVLDIAERSAVDEAVVDRWMARWPAVLRDDHGAVTGFFGLTCDEGFPHRFDAGDMGTAWTWCTYDPLFIARVLGVEARVTSHCPITGTEVTLRAGPDGVSEVQPGTAAMSMMPPDVASFEDIITTLCHYIWLFETREAAEYWTAENPDTFVVSVAEGFEIARRMTDTVFAEVLGADRAHAIGSNR